MRKSCMRFRGTGAERGDDLLSLDIGMFVEGYCGDTATSWVIGGKATPEQEKADAGRARISAGVDRCGAS